MSAKRQKTYSRCRQNAPERRDKRCLLNTLPPEILGIILRMLPLHDVACTVRLVSRHYSNIAAAVLNSEFLIAGTKLEIAMKRISNLMNNMKTELELQECESTYSVLQIIWSQYRMLKAVTWRYTHPRSRNSPTSCFYGGRVLDNLNCLLQIIPRCSRERWHVSYKDLQIFVGSCEDFMDHFEKVTERRLNKSALISGCKIVDVLDCLVQGRQILSFRTSPRTVESVVTMRLQYVLKHAWFVCLRVPNTNDEHCWSDRQRYMYLRLRRLVSTVNRHRLHKMQFELFIKLRPPLISWRRSPLFTYSGYGEYGGQFFYYGNMSKYTYENKFKYVSVTNAENTDERPEKNMNNSPYCALVMEVELRCSPGLAPLAAKTNLKSEDFEGFDTDSFQELYLKLSIKCAASQANRLPGNFTWEVRSPQRNYSRYR